MKAAVIGGDTAGLTIAWLLSTEMEVDLYEESDRWGSFLGNLSFPQQGETVQVERGETYFFPSYHRDIQSLLDHLNIYTEPRLASYIYTGQYPFSARSLLFSDPKFHSFAPFANKKISQGINTFIRRVSYHKAKKIPPTNLMLKQYMSGLNIEAAVMNEVLSSLLGLMFHYPRDEVVTLPAGHCLDFLAQSDLLNSSIAHPIRFIPSGFDSYINKMLFKGKFVPYLNHPITKVSHRKNILSLSDKEGNNLNYDQIVFCCSAKTTMALLDPLRDEERNALKEIHHTSLPFFLHQDSSIVQTQGTLFTLQPYQIKRGTACAYHTNLALLQNMPAQTPLYLSANCWQKPAAEKTLLVNRWRRPQNSRTMTQAVRHIENKLQGQDGIWYCSNHTYNDTSPMTTGIGAALALAEKMRIPLPFNQTADASG